MVGAPGQQSDAPVTFFAEDDKGKRSEPLELPAEAFDVDPHAGVITYDLNLFPGNPGLCGWLNPAVYRHIDKQVLDITTSAQGPVSSRATP
jgi:hypothetical protein